MKNKKLAAIPLLIAITLSIFGFVYAHWSDLVTIQGTVNMGSVTLAWDPTEVLVIWDNDDNVSAPPYKDIADATWDYNLTSLVEDTHTGKSGYKMSIIEINNAYPSYEVHFTTVTVHNIGTIPINITGIEIADPTGYLNWRWVVSPPTSPCYGYFWRDFNNNTHWDTGEDVMKVLYKNFINEQLDPCESKKGEVDIHFEQAAEECHTYRFTITITGIQWNKA